MTFCDFVCSVLFPYCENVHINILVLKWITPLFAVSIWNFCVMTLLIVPDELLYKMFAMKLKFMSWAAFLVAQYDEISNVITISHKLWI